MYYKQKEGKVGEKEVTEYLKQNGYKIICNNFKCLKGEIDVIAHDNKNIIFVEVKTRTSIKYGEAREAVDSNKQKHIYEAARYFMYVNKIEEAYARIDVVEVYIHNRKSQDKPYQTSDMRYAFL